MKKIRNLCESDFLKVFFAFYTLCFLVAAPFMPDRANMLPGLWKILSMPTLSATSFFDYGGSLYPQGIIGDQILYFNHEDIAKVVFEGYHDEDDEMMVENINKWYEESNVPKGNPANFKKA